jgi:hypothetical protein
MKLIQIASLLVTLTVLSACSPNGNVSLKAVDISTSQINSVTYVNLDAIVTLGSLKFPNIEVPLLNPNTMHSIGQMALQQMDDGTNRLSVSIDYNEATHLDPSLGKTLPNGRELPIQLSHAGQSMIGISVLEQSKIYVGGDLNREIIVGAAIAIPAFDGVMSQVPIPLNLFYSFPFSTEVSGVAGLFSGPSKGHNGVGIFAKKSVPSPHLAKTMTLANSAGIQSAGAIPVGADVNQIDPLTLFRLDRILKKKATLKVK